jgi:hypothetical protein
MAEHDQSGVSRPMTLAAVRVSFNIFFIKIAFLRSAARVEGISGDGWGARKAAKPRAPIFGN